MQPSSIRVSISLMLVFVACVLASEDPSPATDELPSAESSLTPYYSDREWNEAFKKVMYVSDFKPPLCFFFSEIMQLDETLTTLKRLAMRVPEEFSKFQSNIEALVKISDVSKDKCSPEYLKVQLLNQMEQMKTMVSIYRFLEHYAKEQLRLCGQSMAENMENTKLSSEDVENLEKLYAFSLPSGDGYVAMDESAIIKGSAQIMRTKLDKKEAEKLKKKEKFEEKFKEIIVDLCDRVVPLVSLQVDDFQQLAPNELYREGLGRKIKLLEGAGICKHILITRDSSANKEFVKKVHKEFKN